MILIILKCDLMINEIKKKKKLKNENERIKKIVKFLRTKQYFELLLYKKKFMDYNNFVLS